MEVLETQVPFDESQDTFFWSSNEKMERIEVGDSFIIKPAKVMNKVGHIYQDKKLQHKYKVKLISKYRMFEPRNTDPRELSYYKALPQSDKDLYEFVFKNSRSLDQKGSKVPSRWHLKIKVVAINGAPIINRFF